MAAFYFSILVMLLIGLYRRKNNSFDALPSKNQVLCKFVYLIIQHYNIPTGIFIKSLEKGFLTKGRIVMHTHFKIAFKWALHFSNNKI